MDFSRKWVSLSTQNDGLQTVQGYVFLTGRKQTDFVNKHPLQHYKAESQSGPAMHAKW